MTKAKVKISFTDQKELEKIIELLQPVISGSVKISKNDEGQYKKAYLDLSIQ